MWQMVGEEPLRCTQREFLEAQAEAGDAESQLILAAHPDPPAASLHVWEAFRDLDQTRGSNGFGPGPITRHDIHAYERDEFIWFRPWERRAILSLDRLLRSKSEPKKKKA